MNRIVAVWHVPRDKDSLCCPRIKLDRSFNFQDLVPVVLVVSFYSIRRSGRIASCRVRRGLCARRRAHIFA